MTRNDILGFVELLPVDDDSDLWELVSDLLAKEVVKRLGDLDPKTVLVALCNAKADDTKDNATDTADDKADDVAEDVAEDVEAGAEDDATDTADDAADDAEAGAEEDKADDAPAEEAKPAATSGGYGSYGSGGKNY